MQSQSKNAIQIFILLVLFSACDSNSVYREYKSIADGWVKQDPVVFNFSIKDSSKLYNMFVNLRVTNAYKFNNIYVVTQLAFPHGKTITDTLEYRMADATGKLLGQGLLEAKENILWYKEKLALNENGEYQFKIEQVMRELGQVNGVDTLNGVLDVGLQIEQFNY